MAKYIIFLSWFIITTSMASAAERPACINDVITAPKPYGTATLNKLFWHVYDAEFWTDGKGWNQDTAHALHLIYGVEIDKEDFAERTIKELKRQPDVTDAMIQEFEKTLPRVYADVVDGDSITAIYQPGKGLAFCHNGKPTGMIDNASLIRPFFGIWLGEHTSEPDIRDGLLAK